MNNPDIINRNTTRAQLEAWNLSRCEALNSVALKLLNEVAISPDIQNLKGLVHFMGHEAKQWRELFERQRGGKAFMALQLEVIALRFENRKLKKDYE
jgi:hypothetical protein